MSKWSTHFKCDAYRFYKKEGLTPKQAFAKACHRHKKVPSGCMTQYASSYMSDDIKNWLRKEIKKCNLEVINYFDVHSLDLEI